MAKDSHSLSNNLANENTGGLLAEEDEFDRRTLWRLGSWAAASVGAVVIALLANQTSIGIRREQIASADLVRQSQIQSVARESQSEARRLASAIETLNSDRDRLYARVAVLEQGLDSVTGAIARQQTPAVTSPQAAAPAETPATVQKSAPAPVVSPVAAKATTATTPAPATAAEKTPPVAAAAEPGPAPAPSGAQADSKAPAVTPATPLVAAKSMMAPPDPAAGKLIEPSPPSKTVSAEPIPEVVAAATSPVEEAAESASAPAAPRLAVQRTEFGVDVGGANSLPGLRALWRGLLKSRSNAALTTLRPIIVIKEGNNGLGMQLRLVAGPINDAAAAAKICAGMIENDRTCTTTVFEGQRLAMSANEPVIADAKPAAETKSVAETKSAADTKPASAAKPFVHRRYAPKRAAKDEPAPKPEPSTMSLIFGRR